MTAHTETPAHGLHHGVPFAEYRAWPCINSGAIRWMHVSPRHGRAYLEGRIADADSSARRFGRAVHVRVLEGADRFREEFVVAEPCFAALASGDRKGERCGRSASKRDANGHWYCGTHAKGFDADDVGDFVSEEEASRIDRMAERLHGHEALALLRRPGGYHEVSAVWSPEKYEQFGVRLKGRLDRYSPADGKRRPIVIDLKKCRVGKAGKRDCEKSISDYEWHRQAAIYVNAIWTLTGARPVFVWLFVEEAEPYEVNVIQADPETLACGWHEVEEALTAYVSAGLTGREHGYMDDVDHADMGGLPHWRLKRWRQSMETPDQDQPEGGGRF